MKNKKTLIILGVLAVAGVGYYFWTKTKEKTSSSSDSSTRPSIGHVNLEAPTFKPNISTNTAQAQIITR